MALETYETPSLRYLAELPANTFMLNDFDVDQQLTLAWRELNLGEVSWPQSQQWWLSDYTNDIMTGVVDVSDGCRVLARLSTDRRTTMYSPSLVHFEWLDDELGDIDYDRNPIAAEKVRANIMAEVRALHEALETWPVKE